MRLIRSSSLNLITSLSWIKLPFTVINFSLWDIKISLARLRRKKYRLSYQIGWWYWNLMQRLLYSIFLYWYSRINISNVMKMFSSHKLATLTSHIFKRITRKHFVRGKFLQQNSFLIKTFIATPFKFAYFINFPTFLVKFL